MILKDGQSFVIAGLVNDQVVEQFSKIPGLGNLPILGKFFKSRSITKSKDELLIMVTPHIVRLRFAAEATSLAAVPGYLPEILALGEGYVPRAAKIRWKRFRPREWVGKARKDPQHVDGGCC